MKILAILLLILSISKLCIAGSFEKRELAKSLFYLIKDNLDGFQKNAILVLIIEGILGLLCGLALLF